MTEPAQWRQHTTHCLLPAPGAGPKPTQPQLLDLDYLPACLDTRPNTSASTPPSLQQGRTLGSFTTDAAAEKSVAQPGNHQGSISSQS